jgi:hypothetical protein
MHELPIVLFIRYFFFVLFPPLEASLFTCLYSRSYMVTEFCYVGIYENMVCNLSFRLSSRAPNFCQDYKLCLVCFQENEFLETIFPTFPCLVHPKKIGQRKLNSGQRKTKAFMPGKCFPFLILRKTLSFLFNKTCILLKYNKSLNSHSLPNNLPRSIGSISHSFFPGKFFSSNVYLFIFFIFLLL